jgi:hypothetical protein
LERDSLISAETVPSQKAHKDENFDPDWIDYGFTAWARCSSTACKQRFAIGGRGGVEPQYTNDEGDWDYCDFFRPLFCYPMPHIIGIPKKCPDNVAFELEGAFSVFWSNTAACAGRIRVAIELMMDQLGVPKRKKNAKGSFYDLQLHRRVEIFSLKEPVIGQQLMALKWLGNAGSHVGAVNQSDLLDAFEILEHALSEIVDRRAARVALLAKKMLKKHSGK